MRNIAPTRRLQRRARDFLLTAALVFLFGAALLAIGIALHIFGLVSPFNRGYAVYDVTRKALLAIGLSLQLAAIWMALRAITWKTDNALARQLGAVLAPHLGPRFFFIRHISGRAIGPIDAALVSPHGLLVLRINDRRGEFAHAGGQWLQLRPNGKWRPLRWNPTREAAQDAVKLKEYLNEYDLGEVPVYAAVVFLHDAPAVELLLDEPDLPVVYASALIESLGDSYFAAKRIDTQTAREVVNLFYP